MQQQAHSFCRKESRAVKPQRIWESAAKAYRLYSVYTGSSSSVKANWEWRLSSIFPAKMTTAWGDLQKALVLNADSSVAGFTLEGGRNLGSGGWWFLGYLKSQSLLLFPAHQEVGSLLYMFLFSWCPASPGVREQQSQGLQAKIYETAAQIPLYAVFVGCSCH